MSLRGRIAAGAITLCSSGLVLFLGTWEGNGQNTVYPDKLAGGLPTVCKGITRHTSPYPVIVGDYWSPARWPRWSSWWSRKASWPWPIA